MSTVHSAAQVSCVQSQAHTLAQPAAGITRRLLLQDSNVRGLCSACVREEAPPAVATPGMVHSQTPQSAAEPVAVDKVVRAGCKPGLRDGRSDLCCVHSLVHGHAAGQSSLPAHVGCVREAEQGQRASQPGRRRRALEPATQQAGGLRQPASVISCQPSLPACGPCAPAAGRLCAAAPLCAARAPQTGRALRWCTGRCGRGRRPRRCSSPAAAKRQRSTAETAGCCGHATPVSGTSALHPAWSGACVPGQALKAGPAALAGLLGPQVPR